MIQGQKNGTDSTDALVDTKFKEYVCKYLEAPLGVPDYQAEILDVLGHQRVFRIISYYESGHTYAHFERLSDGFWKSLGPTLGYSSDNVYPLVNKGCVTIEMPDGTNKCDQSQPFWSDGGFGLMQLTKAGGDYLPIKVTWEDGSFEYLPSYEQIWNWKKNIDGGVNLIKDKINISKKMLKRISGGHLPDADSIGKSILRMETYYHYGRKTPGTSTYWIWDENDGWVFSTEDWIYADEVREVEDAVDASQYSMIPGWKYNGE